MEDLSNIGIVHPQYADERTAKWQAENKDTKIHRGDYVKTRFVDGDKIEHMWVCVSSIIKDKIHGVLNNDPILVTNIKCDDKVIINRSDVSAHMQK